MKFLNKLFLNKYDYSRTKQINWYRITKSKIDN